MAATSTLPYGRQKKSVYGKASRSNWATNFFDDSDDELASLSPAPSTKPTSQRSTSEKAVYPVQKTEVRKAEPAKEKKTKQDTFDVPSSDDDSSPPVKIVQKPPFRTKRMLVDDQTESEASLAPWEQNTLHANKSESNDTSKRTKFAPASPDDQLRSDLIGAARSQKQSAGSRLNGALAPTQSLPASGDEHRKLQSSVARLAARKRAAELNLSSTDLPSASGRSRVVSKAASEGIPRKRAKISRESSADVMMTDDATLPHCNGNDSGLSEKDKDAGIYDFPDSSADESSQPRQRSKSPRVIKKPPRRPKPTSSAPRSTLRKGLSAPARLAEMLPTDSDITEPSTRSPSASISRERTPARPSTPPLSNKRSSPDTAIKSRGNITPKQAQLWNKLLPSQNVAPSPSALAMKDLTISGQKLTSEKVSAAKRLTKAQSELGRRRTRLVDRLKASAESSSEDESDESSSEPEDVDISDVSEAVQPKPPLLRAESTQSRAEIASGSQSQSRSQPIVAASTGFKRTYASQRSHLAEDNLEEDIMAGLMDETPKQPTAKPKVFGRAQAQSNKDAFDMDDSDDDAAGTGAIRTIHELRAAGRKIRGTEEIEQLLEDIENHSTSHKSRRRSALIELATKLADKNFAGRYIGQGCDVRLARQCNGSPDDVASFVLAGAMALLLVSDPPEHTLRTLQENDIVSWLGTLLTSADDVGKVAKDRKNNMARASQMSLVELAKLLQTHQSLWSEVSPTIINTRTIALKTLDLIVGKLRRAGDKSELLNPERLPQVLPANSQPSNTELETSLAISTLESLSTASLALAWDADLLTRIAGTLTALETSTPRHRHTFFLALRLTLNLTTDNPRNCDILATNNKNLVPFLLQTVLTGFTALDAETDDDTRTLALDILVLALGILISLFEHSSAARAHAVIPNTINSKNGDESTLITLLTHTFVAGQQRTLDAESVAESISNVALGYLAVVLANLCQDINARQVVRLALPGSRLAVLGDAVEEFVLFHQQVDGMAMGMGSESGSFEGEEGKAVWGGFTEKLVGVLERVRSMEEGEGMVG